MFAFPGGERPLNLFIKYLCYRLNVKVDDPKRPMSEIVYELLKKLSILCEYDTVLYVLNILLYSGAEQYTRGAPLFLFPRNSLLFYVDIFTDRELINIVDRSQRQQMETICRHGLELSHDTFLLMFLSFDGYDISMLEKLENEAWKYIGAYMYTMTVRNDGTAIISVIPRYIEQLLLDMLKDKIIQQVRRNLPLIYARYSIQYTSYNIPTPASVRQEQARKPVKKRELELEASINEEGGEEGGGGEEEVEEAVENVEEEREEIPKLPPLLPPRNEEEH